LARIRTLLAAHPRRRADRGPAARVEGCRRSGNSGPRRRRQPGRRAAIGSRNSNVVLAQAAPFAPITLQAVTRAMLERAVAASA
jgi:hypothetical protein